MGRDLRLTAHLLGQSGEFTRGNAPKLQDPEVRITWVDADGTVLYDDEADAGALPNHADRPEIRQAMDTGEGEIVRTSDTFNMNTFYYALRLDDGTVLRLAVDARSISSVFLAAVPVLLIIAVVIFAVCLLLGHLLTTQLIAPIDDMAEHLDEPAREPVYQELEPFARKIRSQHEKILSAAQSRQDFTANVSHELKTPLTAISGYAELIENKMVDGEQQLRFAGEIRKNAARLLSLINDIIQLSELDSAQAPARVQSVELLSLAKEVCGDLEVPARQRRITLQCFGREATVMGDRELLKELLENLVQNAIRYNREGGFVQVTAKEEAGHAQWIVEDNGIGIPEDAKDPGLRAVLPGGQKPLPGNRRHRLRSRHRQAHRPDPQRHSHPGFRPGQGYKDHGDILRKKIHSFSPALERLWIFCGPAAPGMRWHCPRCSL